MTVSACAPLKGGFCAAVLRCKDVVAVGIKRCVIGPSPGGGVASCYWHHWTVTAPGSTARLGSIAEA